METKTNNNPFVALLPQIKSEFTKILTLKSWWIFALVSFILSASFSALIAFALSVMDSPPKSTGIGIHADSINNLSVGIDAGFQVWSGVVIAVGLVQTVMMVFAILSVSSEYKYGTIKSTILFASSKMKVLVAKASAVSVYVIAVTALNILLSFVISYLIVSKNSLNKTLGEIISFGIGWSGFGSILAVVFSSLFALGLAFAIRTSSAVITITIVITNVIGGIIALVVTRIEAIAYLRLIWLDNAFNQAISIESGGANDIITSSSKTIENLNNPQALLVMFAWAMLSLIIGAIVFKKRDV
ncbi:MAG: ABC transporter permease [Candidatus Ancillula sp.]|nr:ABC transporter permease [Candidatus Ancillula sp.]